MLKYVFFQPPFTADNRKKTIDKVSFSHSKCEIVAIVLRKYLDKVDVAAKINTDASTDIVNTIQFIFQILKAKLNLPPYLTSEARGLIKKVF